ncbi:MAG: hypothetical protein WCJ09_11390, partial [Planctomycetota bacterium]
ASRLVSTQAKSLPALGGTVNAADQQTSFDVKSPFSGATGEALIASADASTFNRTRWMGHHRR